MTLDSSGFQLKLGIEFLADRHFTTTSNFSYESLSGNQLSSGSVDLDLDEAGIDISQRAFVFQQTVNVNVNKYVQPYIGAGIAIGTYEFDFTDDSLTIERDFTELRLAIGSRFFITDQVQLAAQYQITDRSYSKDVTVSDSSNTFEGEGEDENGKASAFTLDLGITF